MATQVQLDRSGTWEDIDYSAFEINVGTSERKVAPDAEVTTQARESISAAQDARIRIDGTTVFEGITESPGTVRSTGQVDLQLRHDAVELFEEEVTFTETGPPTDEAVLDAAVANANAGSSFTLDYVGTATTLNNEYSADDRPVKRVFRDMMDRTGKVWWVEPAGSTIHVEPKGNRGTWMVLDAATDGISTRSYNEGGIETVRNVVRVTGTGSEAIQAIEVDLGSVNDYGRRVANYNVEYALTSAEATALAQALIQPEPLASATLAVPESVGDVTQPLVNYTVDYTDDAKDISATGLEIEHQTIEQGRAILDAGGGTAQAVANANRRAKSQTDKNPPGTVINSDRLADDSVDTPQLVDAAVIEAKLADAAVATAKLQNNAVINGKLDDLSVSETKIQDDSISTPKLVAGAVTANEIAADTITAAEIAAGTITALEIASDTITASEIAAGTITALEIAADTITANEIAAATITAAQIDTLDLDSGTWTVGQDTDQPIEAGVGDIINNDSETVINPVNGGFGQVGTQTDAFREMHSFNFVTATPEPSPDVDLSNLRGYDWRNPPEYVAQRERAEGEYRRANPKRAGVDLGHMTNYLLAVCQEQQRVIDELADAVGVDPA